jgi:hypothetical protein
VLWLREQDGEKRFVIIWGSLKILVLLVEYEQIYLTSLFKKMLMTYVPHSSHEINICGCRIGRKREDGLRLVCFVEKKKE